MRKWLLAPVAVGLFLSATLALADTIDQNQPSGPVYMSGFSQTGLAQSFIQTSPSISGAGILLQAGVGTQDWVTISVWDQLPNAGGTMLTAGSAVGTQGEWVDVYWKSVPLTPGETYYLVFEGNTSLGIAGDTNNPYPHGCVYANPGYQIFPTFDYAFRTYTGIGGGGSTGVDTPQERATERTSWGNVKGLFR